ncbi:hypothetical protein CL617_00730 [archaeon]|nr:hypothetical protein [archaeon]|tara:strand:- start:4386 stop:5051 length:666 start_codon:yes stop_codon:yes gene_type:complete
MEENKSPLSEEQIKELNEIASLPQDKQKERLEPFLKSLNPEQVEFLKKQQGQGQECLFCAIRDKKIESKVVYEDNNILAVLDVSPANKGHVLVMPKDHIAFSTEMEDVGHLFNVANQVSKKIYEVFQTGSNIFVANGPEAGQRLNHVVVHVIPRFSEDGINFQWEGKKIEDKEMDEIFGKMKMESIGKKEEVKKEVTPEEKEVQESELKKRYDSWYNRAPI